MPTDPPQNLLTPINAPSEQTLLSYLRYAHHQPHACTARPTNLTPTTLTISFTRTTPPSTPPTLLQIPLHPPLKPPYNPSAHLHRAIYAPAIPPLSFPHRPATYLILSWLLLVSLATFLPAHPLAPFFSPFPFPRAPLKLAGSFTLVVHALEAAYVATLVRRAHTAGAIVQPTVLAAWMLQTAILGFPSLFLLMDALAVAPSSPKRKT